MPELVVEVGPSLGAGALEFLEGHEASTIFHGERWAAALAHSYRHSTRFFVARRGSTVCGVFVVVCQRMWPLGEKWVALPYQFHCGAPVTDNDDAGAALLRAAVEAARSAGALFLEVRTTGSVRTLEAAGFVRMDSGLQVTDLDLRTHDRMKIRRSTRAEVRHAAEGGIVIEHPPPDEGMRLFLDPYLAEMRDLGTPQAGRTFFRALVREVPEQVHVTVARLQGKFVGAILVFGDRHAVFARGTTGTRTALGRKHFVGKALMYAAIEAARERGVTLFHLGITWQGNEGLSAYKSGWGGTTSPVVLYVAALRGAAPAPGRYFGGFGLAKRVWKRLPLSLAEPIGHSVTRWVG